MGSRRPLQPVPALSANVLSTRYSRITTTSKAVDGILDMKDHVQDDAQDSGSVVSGLTSLEGDDDFERLIIQNARDERRLNEALHGRTQPFRKARTHPRVGLTIDNLERNDAQNNNVSNANARMAIKSPPSSSGSTRSDPAVHAPASWGRKGRLNRNWMRGITREEHPQHTPAPPGENVIEQHDQNGANAPRRSVEDSPLSHKSFNQGIPRNDNSGEWDLTFDMNDASILASTPYIPRNTKLDDIREREIESLREQGVATARLDIIRENSPEEMRRPRSSFEKSTNKQGVVSSDTQSAINPEAQSQEQGSPVKRLRKRTNSWQSLSKSQPELGKENSPIAVHRKSVETVGIVERDVVANAERQSTRPISNRKTDSQDLLRRLARVSNTPSPQAPVRPQTISTTQPHSSSQTAVTDTSYSTPEGKEETANKINGQEPATEPTTALQKQPRREQPHDTTNDGTTSAVPSSAPGMEDIDSTPMPVERTVVDPKTPFVMGGWIDTPGPRTVHKQVELPRPQSQSPKQESPRKNCLQEASAAPTSPTESAGDQKPTAEAPEAIKSSLPHPQLPSSALHALVQEARASQDYGEDTIHSLEDLITPLGENETEEDTLQGLTLPTSAPRNEAERERQAEVMHLHRLNQRLRTTSTNIRDVSRGMRRVETRMEHIEIETGEKVPVIVRDLSHEFSPWRWFCGFFWDEHLKTQRESKNGPLRIWGGVTLLGILLTISFIWWASETVAWYVFSLPIFILLSLD